MGGSLKPANRRPGVLPPTRATSSISGSNPEAAHIVLHADWPRVDVTTVDVSSGPLHSADARRNRQIFLARRALHRRLEPAPLLPWDELAACAWLDPTSSPARNILYMDTDLSHGPSYGDTLTWNEKMKPATGVRLITHKVDLDLPRFQKMFVDLITSYGCKIAGRL